jgi:hypothetical protein
MKQRLPPQVLLTRRLHDFRVSYLHLAVIIFAFTNGVSPNEAPLVPDHQDRTPTVVFSYQGKIVPDMGYLHIHLNIDLAKPLQQLTSLSGLLTRMVGEFDEIGLPVPRSERPHHILLEEMMLRNYQAMAFKLIDDIKTINELGNPANDVEAAAHARNKRSLINAIGFFLKLTGSFMGVFKTSEINQLRQRMASHENKVNEIIHDVADIKQTMATHSRHIETLETLVADHEVRLDNLERSSARTALIQSIMADATNHVNHISEATQTMLMHRLSPHLLRPADMKDALSQITTHANAQGFQVMAKTVSDIYQCETSFIAHPDGFDLFVHVPIAREADIMFLYKHLPIPFEINPEKVLHIEPAKPLVATDGAHSRFYTLTLADLSACKQMGGIFLCPNSASYRKVHGSISLTEPDTCAFHLLTENHALIQKICPMRISDPVEDAIQVTPTEFYMMSKHLHQGSITCQGEGATPRTFSARHVAHITMEPGCTATTGSHSVTAGLDVQVEGSPVTYYWPEESLRILGNLSSNQVQQFTNSLEAFREIPRILLNQKLEREALLREQKDLKTERIRDSEISAALTAEEKMRMPSYISWAVSIFIGLLFTAAIAYFVFWYRRNGGALRQMIALILTGPLRNGSDRLAALLAREDVEAQTTDTPTQSLGSLPMRGIHHATQVQH